MEETKQITQQKIGSLLQPNPTPGVDAFDPNTGEPKAKESVCRLQCQGTRLPPFDSVIEENLCVFIAALAKAADEEFQSRIQRVVERYNSSQENAIKYMKVEPKSNMRMNCKFDSDHRLLEKPRPGNNADVCRCGLVMNAEQTPPVLAAVAEEMRRTGGEVI